tara:strand:+ start:40 stop:210 length:171 start_codon:yes stop_codon:yes gene_type:complete
MRIRNKDDVLWRRSKVNPNYRPPPSRKKDLDVSLYVKSNVPRKDSRVILELGGGNV